MKQEKGGMRETGQGREKGKNERWGWDKEMVEKEREREGRMRETGSDRKKMG